LSLRLLKKFPQEISSDNYFFYVLFSSRWLKLILYGVSLLSEQKETVTYWIEKSTIEIYQHFLDLGWKLNPAPLIDQAIENCKLKDIHTLLRLSGQRSLAKIQGLSFTVNLPDRSHQEKKIIHMIHRLRQMRDWRFVDVKKSYIRNVWSLKVIDLLCNLGFDEISLKASSLLQAVQAVIKYPQLTKWSYVVLDPTIDDWFAAVRYLFSQEHEKTKHIDTPMILRMGSTLQILRSSVAELEELKTYGYPFHSIEHFSINIAVPSLEVLRFLAHHFGQEVWFRSQWHQRTLMPTEDLNIHNFLYESGFYDTNSSRKYVSCFDDEEEFDMWTYAFETRNIPLLDWVLDHYEPPRYFHHFGLLSLPRDYLSTELFSWYWQRYLGKNIERLLEMTLTCSHLEAYHDMGDWAYSLYQKITQETDEEIQKKRCLLAHDSTEPPHVVRFLFTDFLPSDLQ